MITYDENFLSELIIASRAIGEDQKSWLITNIKSIPEIKKQKLFAILAEEQKKRYLINKDRIFLNDIYIYKKTKIVNNYNESIERVNEKNILKEISDEMDEIYAEVEKSKSKEK